MNLRSISELEEVYSHADGYEILGKVTAASGPIVRAVMSAVALDDIVEIELETRSIVGKVTGFHRQEVLIAPFENVRGISPGDTVRLRSRGLLFDPQSIKKGQILDAFGKTAGDNSEGKVSPYKNPPKICDRLPITEQLFTGVKAIDCFIPLGKGQRMAVLSEPGVGKSSLLSTIARGTSATTVIWGLIGERGREAAELFNCALDETTRKKTILVVSTSDETAIRRVSAAHTATRLAEYLRDNGEDVLLLIDSLTRFCRAYRELALASGEPAVRRGYPASIFSELPRLLERPGMSKRGSITALYTMLLSGDLETDPMVDEAKSLLDGHILLSRRLAESNRFPAIDLLHSLSRLETRLTAPHLRRATALLRQLLSVLERDRDLVLFGGTPDKTLRTALAMEDRILSLLCQEAKEGAAAGTAEQSVLELYQEAQQLLA